MLPEVTIELDWRGKRYRSVERGLNALAKDLQEDTEKWGGIARRVLREYMDGVVLSVQQRTTTAYPSGTSPPGQFPGTLSRRSGKLSASLNPNQVTIEGDDTNVRVGFTLTGIAAVHERGATIRPKRASYLTIPLPAALDSRGLPRRPNARAWKNTFVQRSKKGNLLIFQKQGKDLVPLYVLKKSVRIPRRLGFEEAFNSGRDFVADKLAQEILKEFTRA